MIRLVLLALSVLLLQIEAASAQPEASLGPRPVEGAEPAARESIRLFAFDFEQPQLYELLVHFGPIRTAEPTAGVRYGVRAAVAGQEEIATAIFAIVDESGKPLARLRLAPQAGGANSYEFIGFMVVPDHPFRVAITGERRNGQAYANVLPRLFKPVTTPPPAALPPGMPADVTEAFQKMLDDQTPQVLAEREAIVARIPTGAIVLPRMRVSNVAYEPLMSGPGRAVGMRVTYDVRFSEAGRYNPVLHVFAEDPTDLIIGRNPLNVRQSAIAPAPRLAHAPSEYADTFRVNMSQLADFEYDAESGYTFTVELVPNFITLERVTFTPCLSTTQRFLNTRDPQAAFERLKNGNGPGTYGVSIGFTGFEGKIDGFYSEGAMYRTFVADQTPPCDERPLPR